MARRTGGRHQEWAAQRAASGISLLMQLRAVSRGFSVLAFNAVDLKSPIQHSAVDERLDEIGHIHVIESTYSGRHYLRVGGVWVEKQSLGTGTALYEAAAHIAWHKFKLPLGSDWERSNQAENFWSKQHELGRAELVQAGQAPSRLYHATDDSFYLLKTPPPSRLDGL